MKSVASLTLIVALGALPALAQDSPKPQQPQGQPAPRQTREQRIAELVKKLGDAQFDVREGAQRELEAIGAPALGALEEATKSADPEVASRATEALARIRAGKTGAQPGQGAPAEEPPLFRGRPVPPEFREMPDMQELMRELQQQMRDLERTMPPEFNDMFRDLFRGRLPGEQPGQGGEAQPEERQGQGGGPRARVWTWSSTPRPRTSPAEQGLGIEVGSANPPLRAQLGIAEDEGLVVTRVDPEGRAAKAGIQLYDVIVGVDGRSARTARELGPLLQGGAKVELYRRAQLQTIQVPAPAPAKAPAPAPTPAPAPAPAPGGSSGERSF